MTRLDRLTPYDDAECLRVVIEAPKGAAVKLRFDPTLNAFAVRRLLPLGLAYPFDWGFIPGTLGQDGDPLDALILSEQATFPGVVMSCRVLGVLEVEQRERAGSLQRNDRLVVAPSKNSRHGKIAHPRFLPKRLRKEIEQFFKSSIFFTDKNIKILGWRGPRRAAKLIDGGIKLFRQGSKKRRKRVGA
jgi:inorganic pyrophosphatase